MIDAVSFWQRRNSNFTSIDLRVSVYDASGVRVWNSARIGNDPGAWQQRIAYPGVSGRYVGIELQGQLGAGAGGMFIDDVVIGRS